MQPHCASSQKGILVRTKTVTLSSSMGTAAGRTQPTLVFRQSGEGADYLTHELDMETTSITTTSTEQHPPLDIKTIDFGQMAYGVFPNGIMGSVEDSVHQDPLAGTSKTAIFDVQSDLSMDLGRELLPFKDTEHLSLPPCVSSLIGSVFPSEKFTPSMPPCVSSMGDCGHSSEMLPCASGMVGSVLPSERPISPSEFLQKNPASSSQPQMEDFKIPPDLLKEIDQLFAETPESITWDSTQQLDLNLFSQLEGPDVLDSIVQEFGIADEIQEESKFHHEGDMPHITVPTTSTQSSSIQSNSAGHVPTNLTQPPRIQSDSVGPVRSRRKRRASRKPVRYRETQSWDDEPTTTEVTVIAELEEVMASTSGTTPTRRKGSVKEELSNEEKYLRSRKQNNLASKRCREKRKENLEKMTQEFQELERKNKALQGKVAQLTVLRDNFKEFVSKFLFQQISQK